MLTLDPATTALAVIDLQRGVLGLSLTPHAGAAVVERSATLGRALAAGRHALSRPAPPRIAAAGLSPPPPARPPR